MESSNASPVLWPYSASFSDDDEEPAMQKTTPRQSAPRSDSHVEKPAQASTGAPANAEEEPSPITASYRQGELIKMMLIFGTLVGLVAFAYDWAMESSLEVFWKIIPAAIERSAAQSEDGLDKLNKWGFLYTMGVSTVLAIFAGLSIKYLGFPGDLPNVIECVHHLGYVPMKQTLPMIFCSLFSIAAGGSLGPEAPLVAVSSSVCGWLSMHYFKHDTVMVRKCTIIGMSAGLSAFFGVQLGGALFALEVLHTMGLQFFDVSVYAVGAGGICLAVYRGLQGQQFGDIWDFTPALQSTATEVILGAVVGAIAGGVGILFRSLFRGIGKCVRFIGLGHFETTKYPVILCGLGGIIISGIGVLVPPSMFWAEFEIDSIAVPGRPLPHVWPQGGVFYGLAPYPWDNAPMYILVGVAKLLSIAVTVQAGFRGGFIFPLFFAGASFGQGLLYAVNYIFVLIDSDLPHSIVHASPVLMAMCFAAGLNVAVTRTPFASPLILAALAGQPNITAPALCAALASLFVTRSSKFIGPQSDRADLQYIGDLQPLKKPAGEEASELSVKAPSMNGGAGAEHNDDSEEDSPMTASYRQGELIKMMAIFGLLVGLIAFAYDWAMESSLELVWEVIPAAMEGSAEASVGGLASLNKWGFLYTITASTILATFAGLSIKYLGFPGDLPNVIKCVHQLGYVPMVQTLPMICCSLFSIAAGGSLGPEAPLVAVSASACGWLSMNYFKHDMAMVRKCTIIGMSAGLSAFFGVQLGGALFALEVLHTMGMQFFDVAVYAVGSGGICLAVYRGLQGAAFGEIWAFPGAPQSTAAEIVMGAVVGAIAGGVGILFRSLFRAVGRIVFNLGLGHFEDSKSPVVLCALGGLTISVIGVLLPPTMFWAEFEIESIAVPGTPLPHVWPQGGIFYGLEAFPLNSAGVLLLVGAAKLLAIAVTVQAGFRGGFIFPLFFAGASLGQGLLMLVDFAPPESIVHTSSVLMAMCFAAGLNVAVTRTPFASPLILSTLAGQPNVMAPALCAALASLFVTRSSKFIGPQSDRADLQYIGDLQPLQAMPSPLVPGGADTNGGVIPGVVPPTPAEEGDEEAAGESSHLVGSRKGSGGYSAIADSPADSGKAEDAGEDEETEELNV